jgi:hypothetical protein
VLEGANTASQNMIETLKIRNETLQKLNDDFVYEVKELKEKFESDSRRLRREAEIQVRDAK